MNYRSLSIILLSLCMLLNIPAHAQLDSRGRTPETVITDGLAQLPAKTPAAYNETIGEMAATGAKGMEMLAGMLKPAATNQNATFEYAIDAIVSYVTREDKAALRQGVHDGLVAGLKKSTDKPNTAFLISQLNKLATPADTDLYVSYLSDHYLKHYAVIGLSLIPGIDDTAVALINNAAAPDSDLAYLAYFRKLAGAEATLLKWAESNDPKVREAVNNALAVCGSNASIKTLQKAAKAAKFGNDPTAATNSYLRLLSRLGNDKSAMAAAKELTKCSNRAARCAGLDIILKADGANATKNILDALKDKDIQYRNTALLDAQAAAGDGIFEAVAAKYNSLSPEAQTDVIEWLGNNHAAAQIDIVTKTMDSKNAALANAALIAASKIGGDKALAALIAKLGTDSEVSMAAEKALLSFNGSINDGIIAALNSSDSKVVAQALKLASARHIYDAYAKTASLINSEDATIREIALNGLSGVVRPSNFNDICVMLESATAPKYVNKLQLAAKSAISSESPENQYKMISARLANAKARDRYYPMLAQAATPEAIEYLLGEYAGANKQAAFNALLQVKSPAMIDVLYDLAAKNPASKDAILARYLQLVSGAGLPAIDQYRRYRDALALQPSTAVTNSLLQALANSRTLPAAMLAANYLDNKDNALAAATTVKYIFAKEDGLRRGAEVKGILEKAHKVFKDFGVNDADAGYAADEVAGMLNTIDTNGGYATVAAVGPAGEFENFDLYFDWNGTEPITLTLRSMPLVTFDPSGVTVGKGILQAVPAGVQPVHVRMINDRMFVEVGSVPFAVNEVVVNPNGKKTLDKGTVAVSNPAAISNFYFNSLPDTPVFTLSPEEEAEGFEVLFDGRSLEKWHGNTSAYVPVDGNIYVTAQYGGSGNLYTKKNYSDFIYRFEFCFDVPGVNNGIGIRTGKDVTGVDAAFHGMEIQVLDHDDPMYGGYNYNWTGIQPYQIHGSIYGVVGAKHLDFGPIKQWHTEEIKAIGDHITVTVDGEVIVDANIREACQGHAVGPEGTEGNPYMIDHRNHPGLFNKEGYISFCGHGPGVKFRNIRILDLSDKSKNKSKSKKSKK